MATHSSILAWEIPWAEEPGRLQSTELQRVGWTRLSRHTCLQSVLESEETYQSGFQEQRIAGWGKMSKNGQKIQISSYKMNKFWECNVRYGDCGYLKADKKVDF